jgi:hypothetical protein
MTNAVALRDAKVEIVALHVHGVAGEVVTQRRVDAELERLRGHPDGCRCGSPYSLARDVAPSRVYWQVRTWRNSIATRKVLGAH